MENSSVLISCLVGLALLSLVSISGLEVFASSDNQNQTWIPEEEIVSYFDSNGIYTVGGNVKNQADFAILPIISLTVIDGESRITKTISHVPIPAETDIPFKVKFPEVQGKNPEIITPILTFKRIELEKSPVQVIYDKTLKKHDDGHVTGNIKNIGNQTIFYPKVFAIANGHDGALDIVQNVEFIEKIGPGEMVGFSMYVDPGITEDIFYYSCFAVTDSFVQPMYTERNGEKFYFRYDSGTWFTSPQFNERGTELTMRTLNSYPLETYVNFEFPSFADDEHFEVYVNDEKKKIIQSIDERGNWHVAYTVQPREGGEVRITGFKEGWNVGDRILIPDWIKVNALWWANGLADEETFLTGLEFMIKEKIIAIPDNVDPNTKPAIPEWFKNTATWWAEDKIENITFVNGLQNLIDRNIIKI